MHEEYSHGVPPPDFGFPAEGERAPAPEEEQPPASGFAEKLGRELFYWMQTLVSALVCIVLVFTFFGRFTRVVGTSMVPTLTDGELLLVWSLGYSPRQGDVVVLNKTTVEFLEGEAIVKRVVATGGQTVEIDYEAGTVYVDGEALDEPYLREAMRRPPSVTMSATRFQVPEGSVFVMGDNRNASADSRDERLSTVDTRYILGKAVFCVFPLTTLGPV